MSNNDVMDKIVYLRLDDIIPNRFQPREVFEDTGLEELSKSIKEHGVIQPIVVRPIGDKYELIAGERRCKASSLAGLTTIPAIVRQMDDNESAKVSLLENLQRRDLSPIEEARTYKRILELDNMTQEDLAKTMGKSQPLVANKIRLLSLPEEVQDALIKNQISERHARSLINIKDKEEQLELLERIKKERLTVRQLEAEIKKKSDAMMNNNYNGGTNQVPNGSNMGYNPNQGNNYNMNYNSMGLNDYTSQVNQGLFNNIPNNFGSPTPVNNQSFDYGNFGDSSNQDNTTNNTFIQNPINNDDNNDSGGNGSFSLGAMFDRKNVNDIPSNNTMNNDYDDNKNIFISRIREEEVSSGDNQFIPKFDSMNQQPAFNEEPINNQFGMSDYGMGQNNHGQSEPTDFNQFSSNMNNYNQGMMGGQNTFYGNQGSPANPNNQYNDNSMLQNPYYPSNQGYMDNNQYNQNNNNNQYNGFAQGYNGQGMYQQPAPMNDYGMNPNNNGPMNNNYNQFSGIPDMYQNPNQPAYGNNGFGQPLKIVDVPTNHYQEPIMEQPEEKEEIPFDNPLDDKYENILYADPVPIQEEVQVDEPVEEKMEEIKEEVEVIEDAEVIDDHNSNIEENNNYIRLDEERTIFDVSSAVLEVKKATDKIKYNGFEIETEEIDYDDSYQITIKIKKEQG